MFTYYNILCALMCLSTEYLHFSPSPSLYQPYLNQFYMHKYYIYEHLIFFLFMFYILKRRIENVMNYDYCPLNAANATITQIYRSIFEEYFEFKLENCSDIE